MRIDLLMLYCGCHSWIQGDAVHLAACGRMGHAARLLAAARESGIPVDVVP